MEEGRWTTITPSQFQHEREALDHIRRLVPDSEPYRAWSNFTFTADTGHVREVDLLVAAPSGLYLIEVKSLHGRLSASGSNWILSGPTQSTCTFDNPLHLADAKAKQLKSLLQRVAGRHHVRVPFIQAAVFLSVPSLQVELPDHQLHLGVRAGRRRPAPQHLGRPAQAAARRPAAAGDARGVPQARRHAPRSRHRAPTFGSRVTGGTGGS